MVHHKTKEIYAIYKIQLLLVEFSHKRFLFLPFPVALLRLYLFSLASPSLSLSLLFFLCHSISLAVSSL